VIICTLYINKSSNYFLYALQMHYSFLNHCHVIFETAEMNQYLDHQLMNEEQNRWYFSTLM